MPSSEFLLTALVVVLIPGTGVLYTVSVALLNGRRASLFAALGCTLGILPALLASLLGLALVLHISAVAFQVMKLAGVVYLLYLAWSMWRSDGTFSGSAVAAEVNLRAVALRGFLINILNPKLSIFFLAFLPQFIEPAAGLAQQMLALGGVFMGMTFAVFVVYGTLASALRQQVITSPRIMRYLQRSFAALFAALATRLAVAER